MHSTSIMIADGLHLLMNFPDLGFVTVAAPRNNFKSKYEDKKVTNYLIL